MNRIPTWIALVAALVVIGAALYEINSRESDKNLAIPTAVPSPSSVASPAVSPEGSALPSGSEAASTEVPTTSVESEGTEAPSTEETVAPPPTATPEPPLATHNPLDTSGDSTPTTGANPVPAGVALTLLAGAGFAAERRTRRSY